MTKNRKLILPAVLAGIVLIAIGVIYLAEPAGSLPSFFPGHEAGSGHHHVKHALLAFVLIAAAVFFFVVIPVNALVQRARREPTPDPTTKKCPECLSEIPIDARRCAFCTTQLS